MIFINAIINLGSLVGFIYQIEFLITSPVKVTLII